MLMEPQFSSCVVSIQMTPWQPESDRNQSAICSPKHDSTRQQGSFPKSLNENKDQHVCSRRMHWKTSFQVELWDDCWRLSLFPLLCLHWWQGLWTDGTETVPISHQRVPSVGVSWLLTCYITQYVVLRDDTNPGLRRYGRQRKQNHRLYVNLAAVWTWLLDMA